MKKKLLKNNLAKIIEERKLNISHMAKDLGVTRMTIKNWRDGKDCTVHNAAMISDYLGLSIWEIWDLEKILGKKKGLVENVEFESMENVEFKYGKPLPDKIVPSEESKKEENNN